MKCALISPIVFSMLLHNSLAQTTESYSTAQAHSHNDSRQLRPFTEAFDQQFGSIETDVLLNDGKLYAVNHEIDASENRSLENLYLKPISERVEKNSGLIYVENDVYLQLVFDLITPASETLPALTKLLEKYKNLTESNCTVKIVITGNIPAPELFDKYPDYIQFEGSPDIAYTPAQLERVALIGQSLQKYTGWNGEGPLPKNDRKSISRVVQKAHELGKKIRFHDAPDNINTWKTMMALRVDYLDTGKVIQMGDYLRTAPR